MMLMPLLETLSVWNGCTTDTPEPVSVAVHFTVTLSLFQPAAFAAGVKAAATTGPVLSSMYEPCTVADWLVHFPCLFIGEAAAVTDCTPSPAGAVAVNVHDVLAVADSA
ncbi:hypothetical protein [Terrabacter carboxydivorans]|uniref:hypothetical protein n=1 Tax=Terrabacter carboxydivorans TaxID=619730 RepID=UPI0031D5DFA6